MYHPISKPPNIVTNNFFNVDSLKKLFFIPFPFSGLVKNKKRPGLIISVLDGNEIYSSVR